MIWEKEFDGSKTGDFADLLHFYYITRITAFNRTASNRRIRQKNESEETEMAKEKGEMKAILMAQEVYMPDGETPNTAKLNMISGVVIPPLMEAMCQEREDIAPIEAIEAYLWELHEKSEYPTIAGVLRVLFLLHEIDVPEILDALLQYDDPALMEVLLYEFLMDFSDAKLDYQGDCEETDE